MMAENLRHHLRLNSDRFDTQLQQKVDAAKCKADFYCNNPFLAADGVTAEAIPADVEEWILKWAATQFKFPTLGENYASLQAQGVYRRDLDYNVTMEDLKHYRMNPRMATSLL